MIATLCGFMGSGKSTIGKYLADILCCSYKDLDREIEIYAKCSIADFFQANGETQFRELEFKTLQKLLNIKSNNYIDSIISLGGGTLTNPEAEKIITNNTTCIYLKCNVETLTRRLIKNNSNRPLLAGKTEEEIREFTNSAIKAREEAYLRCAKYTINCENKNIAQICDEITGLNL